MPVDLLVFGAHPDDIEIGLGGAVAKHTAEGRSVGLCDLTAGELGSNGTREERLAESQEAARVLGALWRENLGWPDGDINDSPERLRSAVDLIRTHQPRTIALPYWDDRHPDHVAASRVLTVAAFRSGLRRFDTGIAPWRAEWVCYYFINDSRRSGSRTARPSANRTPACAPNCASRLSISCRKLDAVSRVSTLPGPLGAN